MKRVLWFLLILGFLPLVAVPVSSTEADTWAADFAQANNRQSVFSHVVQSEGQVLARVYQLLPQGYVVITADTDLPPVIAYSTGSVFSTTDNTLQQMLTNDLRLRLLALPAQQRDAAREAWSRGFVNTRPEQWPPVDYSNNGGWCTTRWTQTSPYNDFCPHVPASGAATYAGCPAVTMGQIANYHKTINGTRFTSADRYRHNYGGLNFWFDDGAATYDFPDFTTLNGYLDTLTDHFRHKKALTDQDKAALVFACGLAAQQVYGTQGSGTFGVSQALQAYNRFSFSGMELLGPDASDLWTRVSNNIREGLPVHLAVVTPANDSGHNLVIDGYNTNDYYHLNFGWGGSNDGWYLLPSGLPYNLTVVEGIIVDIHPYDYFLLTPDTFEFTDQASLNTGQTVTVFNQSSEALVVDSLACDLSAFPVSGGWQVDYPELPYTLEPNAGMDITIRGLGEPVTRPEGLSTTVSVYYNQGREDIPVYINPDLVSASQSVPEIGKIVLSNHPNPFNPSTTISYNLPVNGPVRLEVYNARGQKVSTLVNSVQNSGDHTVLFDGTDSTGRPLGSGVYFYRLESCGKKAVSKMLMLK